ncbi:MAG: T9SS type A sorting domain-containing protein [Candidatus Cloacimonetes bacterium]|nr:T9SS type A sorting domain-containing protein [Candidatus Cloacimonadota bacterium]
MNRFIYLLFLLLISLQWESADAVGITFSFANPLITGSGSYFEFDVFAAASESGTKFGDSQVYINYSQAAFGSSVVANENVTVTKGILTQGELMPGLPLYTEPLLGDNTTSRFGVQIGYNFESAPQVGNDLPDYSIQVFHVVLTVIDFMETTEISFEQSLMDQIYYSDNNTEYSPVITQNELDTPLPVGLSQFTGIYLNGNVCLNWTTQSEYNNSYWCIYRSVSQNFGQALLITATPIPGAGTSSQPTFYQYEDSELQDYINFFGLHELETFWYWLESVSYEGESHIFEPVAVELSEPEPVIPPNLPDQASGLIRNYPNPFNPITYFEVYLPGDESGTLRIFNLKGEIVEKSSFQAGHQLYMWDASGLSSGFYLAEFSSYGRETRRIKIMLLK